MSVKLGLLKGGTMIESVWEWVAEENICT